MGRALSDSPNLFAWIRRIVFRIAFGLHQDLQLPGGANGHELVWAHGGEIQLPTKTGGFGLNPVDEPARFGTVQPICGQFEVAKKASQGGREFS